MEGSSWYNSTIENPAWDFHPPPPQLLNEEVEAENASLCIFQYKLWKLLEFLDLLEWREKGRKTNKEIWQHSYKDEYNMHCKSIYQSKANALTGKMFSLNSNKIFLLRRSKAIFIFLCLQRKLCYQNQILLIQIQLLQRNLKF